MQIGLHLASRESSGSQGVIIIFMPVITSTTTAGPRGESTEICVVSTLSSASLQITPAVFLVFAREKVIWGLDWLVSLLV